MIVATKHKKSETPRPYILYVRGFPRALRPMLSRYARARGLTHGEYIVHLIDLHRTMLELARGTGDNAEGVRAVLNEAGLGPVDV